jgi:hypothetical protein
MFNLVLILSPSSFVPGRFIVWGRSWFSALFHSTLTIITLHSSSNSVFKIHFSFGRNDPSHWRFCLKSLLFWGSIYGFPPGISTDNNPKLGTIFFQPLLTSRRNIGRIIIDSLSPSRQTVVKRRSFIIFQFIIIGLRHGLHNDALSTAHILWSEMLGWENIGHISFLHKVTSINYII